MTFKRSFVYGAIFVITFAAGLIVFTGTTVLAEYLTQSSPSDVAGLPLPADFPSHTGEAALPLSPPVAIAETIDSNEEDASVDMPKEIEWHGLYAFDAESMPRAFSGLSHIEVTLYDFDKADEDGNPGAQIPPRGYLQGDKAFNFKRIALAGRQIAFQTETVKGVSYRFTGKRLVLDYCETDGPTPDVSGELIKIVNGKWAASMKVELYEECGC